MYKMLILSIVALLSVGCSSSKDESGGSGGKISDITANLSGKISAITIDSTSNNSRASRRSSNTSTLVVQDNQNNFDYGVISEYNLQVDQVVQDPNGEYAYIVMEYDSHLSTSGDRFLHSVNCTVFKVKLSNNKIGCLYNGISALSTVRNKRFTRDAYAKPIIQFGDNDIIFVRSEWTDQFSIDSNLRCNQVSCLYRVKQNEGIAEKLTPDNAENSRYLAMSSGQVVYTGWLYNGNNKWSNVHSELILHDLNNNRYTLTDSYGNGFHTDYNVGEYKTVIFGTDHREPGSNIEFVRLNGNILKKSYLYSPSSYSLAIIKSNTGDIFVHGSDGLRRILPKKDGLIVDVRDYLNQNSSYCGDSMNCFIFYDIIDDIVIHSKIMFNYDNSPIKITATKISDNKSVDVISPDANCTLNCFSIDWINEEGDTTSAYKTRSFTVNKIYYISVFDQISGDRKLIKIDTSDIDFDSENNYEILSTDLIKEKAVRSFSNLMENFKYPDAIEVLHEDNDKSSVQIIFNRKMNYENVESKLSVFEKNTNNKVGFMPIWSRNKLHLVFDTDDGTVFNNEENLLTHGVTYTVHLSGSAKDANGNTIGSDIIKDFTP